MNLYHTISERTFTQHVIKLARVYKWRVAHFRPAMTKRGRWVTAMSGDVGFPDLVLSRGNRLIFAELKAGKGRVTPEQKKWLDSLIGAAQCRIWRPSDIDAIESELK